MSHYLSFLFMILSITAFGQLTDNFNDGDFTTNPPWAGETAKFIVNPAFQLQLSNAAIADTAYLTTSAPTADSTVWEFYVRMNFNPSLNNNVRIYLKSDQQYLKGPLNGYFIRIGENGSLDAIDLFRQTGLQETLVMAGIDGRAAVAPQFRIRVVRDSIGNWSIYSDSTGGTNYILEGTGFDNTHNSSSYIGVYCKHTSTNANKFFFDDFYVSPLFTDTIPPYILWAEALGNNAVRVKFSEKLGAATAENIANYFVDQGIGTPTGATLDAQDSSLVQLQFSSTFVNATSYTLFVSNIADLQGNINPADSIHFLFYQPQPGDLVISEFMADPTPPVALPEEEFVEIYNSTSIDIDLSGWTFADLTSTAALPNIMIPADSFAIIVASSKAPLFAGYGIVVPVSSLPTLNNSSDQLTLRDPSGQIIDQVNYSNTWYGNTVKAQGGWTLERISSSSVCLGSANWKASEDPAGGTPGRRNSISGNDITAPALQYISLKAPDSLLVTFNEAISPASALDINNYNITPAIGNPLNIILQADPMSVMLVISPVTDSSITYILTVNNIADCAGNMITSPESLTFSFPEPAAAFDILITEIMADPDPPQGLPNAEYVELFNRSNKNISLKDWKYTDGTGTATLPEFTISPGQYILLSSTVNAPLFSSYAPVIPLSPWPSLNNAGDSLRIINAQGKVIHFVNYSDSWYNNNIKKNGGWSLEMVDTANPCQGAGNWKASDDPSGGTPGAANSVSGNNPDVVSPKISKVVPIDHLDLMIYFSEAVIFTPGTQIFIDPAVGIDNVQADSFNYTILKVRLSSPLQFGEIYTLIVQGITDCAGNKNTEEKKFGLPEDILPGELLVNEILYNPVTGGVDFVEIYNRSQKILDLKDVLLARTDIFGDVLNFTPVAPEGQLVLPGEYFAFTSNADLIRQQYYTPAPENILQISGMPSYPDQEGGVAIIKSNTQVIDRVYYYDDWQFALIDDHNGISLERISFEGDTQDENNWHSAATTVRATPAYRNSQSVTSGAGQGEVWVEPEIFSPDSDGYNDLQLIKYDLESNGYTATVIIFNAKGQPVRHLLSNELLAKEGHIVWDGTMNDRTKAAPGIYIIYFEAFSLSGGKIVKKIRSAIGAAH